MQIHDVDPPRVTPVFVDASGRRGSVARRATQAFGLVLLLYVVLFAAAVLHAPGASHIALPGVGRLFPEGGNHLPPHVEGATVVANRGANSTTPAKTASAATATHRVPTPSAAPTTATPAAATAVTTRRTRSTTASGPTTTPSTSGGTTGSTTVRTPAGHGPNGSGPPGQQNHTGSGGGNGSSGSHGHSTGGPR